MNPSRPSPQARAFTSVLIAAAFFALSVSGAFLFLSPPGRVANWSDWRMLGLTKHEWTGLHVWFGLIFLVAAMLHLVFNFRPLFGYFRDRLTRQLGFRREWMAAIGLCGAVFIGVRADFPPFSSFLAFNERIKRSWEDPRRAAPMPHAELLSVKELAEKAEVPLETALQRLTNKGIQGATAETIVSRLAGQNDLSAERIYEIMQGVSPQSRGGAARRSGSGPDRGQTESATGEFGHGPSEGGGGLGGAGPGRMTLTEYCSSRNIDIK